MVKSVVFSVVIPTLNEEKYLPDLLQDLAAQTFTNFEVIVADANSQDQTLKNAKTFDHQFKLKLLSSTQANVSHQRNLGGQAATGEWILFMDADTRIPRYFFQGIKYQLEKREQTDIFSCMIDSKNYDLTDRPIIEFMNLAFAARAKVSPMAMGAFIGLRRSLFANFTFNEDLTMAEDQEFINRVTTAGYDFRFFREPCYIFSLRRHKKDSLLSLVRKYVSSDLYIISKGQLIKKLPDYPMKGGTYYEEDWDPDHDSRS